MQLEYYI